MSKEMLLGGVLACCVLCANAQAPCPASRQVTALWQCSADPDKQNERRYRALADFNFDGLLDVALSDPLNTFGNAGGHWQLYVQQAGPVYCATGQFFAHPQAMQLEDPKQAGRGRLLSYVRGSARGGVLQAYDIAASGMQERKPAPMDAAQAERFLGAGTLQAEIKTCQDSVAAPPVLDLQWVMKYPLPPDQVPPALREGRASRLEVAQWTYWLGYAMAPLENAERERPQALIEREVNGDGVADLLSELVYARGATGNASYLLFVSGPEGYRYVGEVSYIVRTITYQPRRLSYIIMRWRGGGGHDSYGLSRLTGDKLENLALRRYNSFKPPDPQESKMLKGEITEAELRTMFPLPWTARP